MDWVFLGSAAIAFIGGFLVGSKLALERSEMAFQTKLKEVRAQMLKEVRARILQEHQAGLSRLEQTFTAQLKQNQSHSVKTMISFVETLREHLPAHIKPRLDASILLWRCVYLDGFKDPESNTHGKSERAD